ncbi:Protein of uncharacterised function (DUF1380) [Shigella sonnei]|nr:Protein of uncharacterised function (DUF1380) [Shigella sonnei]
MYGTCETLCRELAAQYPGDTPLMLVIWSPEEIQALADGMDISLSDHEIRTVLARLEDIPEDQRTESGISSGVAMEIINNVRENRQVTVPAELLASLMSRRRTAAAPGLCHSETDRNRSGTCSVRQSVAVAAGTSGRRNAGVFPVCR